ncbi:Serine/threonine-protein kinase ATG1 [Lachnellula arida]|uniref:non-specific serine/threonine protein kinase n=1 Tax=Lachnellula arida TaxID=1316785 RepID=A0A8T9BHG0_9HELO|nr:Serine/threonine-protein kinase ATG1 [Lachnellula arida]
MSIHPRYIPINPNEPQDIASSSPVLRTINNATFLASKVPEVYTKDSPLDPTELDLEKTKSPDDPPTYNTKLASVIISHAALSLSRILNHPNIISLVDVVQTSALNGSTSEAGQYGDITVWEDMNAGSLAYLTRSANSLPGFNDAAAWHRLASPNLARPSLPESLCWHVLRSISRALLWLHHGVKETEGIPGEWVKHDDDWQAVLIMDVSPGQIWFKKPTGTKGEFYGECKLGGFQWAKVCGSVGARVAMGQRVEDAPVFKQWYWAPEVYKHTQSWTRASELWSLGAVIYTMMTDMPPPRIYSYDWQISRMNDKGYSQGLRNIVGDMLKPEPADRPPVLDLVSIIETEWRSWRANTREGQEFVDVEDQDAARRAFGVTRGLLL